MKILYLISTLGGGGAESQLCTYALELKKTHLEIDFDICAIKQGGVFEKKLSDAGIRVFILNSQNLLKSILMVRKMVRAERYDIVHAHMFLSDIVSRFATIGLKTKIVATHHGLGTWKTRCVLLLDHLSKFRVDRFVMVSQQSYEIRLQREKYPAHKMHVIYNGISDRFLSQRGKCLPKAGEKIVVGTIARMTDNKQINLMIDAVKQLEKYPNLYYELIGEGENYEKLVQQVKDLDLTFRVKFWGWKDDILPITKEWHIFALPSVNEDLPVALMECMAQGIVPVASRVGGIITLLDEGNNGILCDSSKTTTFVSAIEELICNPKEYERYSVNCRKLIQEQFLIGKTVQGTVAIYRELEKQL